MVNDVPSRIKRRAVQKDQKVQNIALLDFVMKKKKIRICTPS